MENAWKLTERSRQGDGTKGWGADTTGAKPMNARARGQQSSNIFGTEPTSYAPKKVEGIADSATE